MNSPGCLWVIATPIGNLGDLSPRARDVFPGLFFLACEQKRSAQRLFQALQMRCPPLLVYREEQSASTTSKILEALDQGQSCGLISDAGTPTLSDPGWRLVRACHEAGHPVRTLPGPSSLTAAVSLAGLPAREFYFAGFPPSQAKARREFWENLCQRRETCVLLVAPHDVKSYLDELRERSGGSRRLSISRELTKIHEETHLHSLEEWTQSPPREQGEFVLVLEGLAEQPQPASPADSSKEVARYLLDQGCSDKVVRELLTRFFEVPRNDAYRLCLSLGSES